MKVICTLFLLIFGTSVYAQSGRTVNGFLKDTTGTTVIGATVKLVSSKDTLQAVSSAQGTFSFKNVKVSQFVISVSSIGYQSFNRRYLFNDGTSALELEPIVLKEESKQLATVTVNATRSVVVKEDTLEYRASDYKLQPNAVTEDLIKKLPGVEVDKDGNVTAQGKEVTKVRVNGKDYFGGDVQTATKNLPAELIEKIQVIDDYGDQANLTGIRTGDSEKILNITIRPDRNKGIFANAVVGAGTDDRYQTSVNGNYFNNTRQISLLANLNNVNASLFSGGSGGSGSSRGSSSSGSSSFFGSDRSSRGSSSSRSGFGGSDGITNVGAIGVNYRDQWGKKLTSYGSYSYFSRDNDVLQNVLQESVYRDGNIISNQTNNTNSVSNNHRFNWSLEYQVDTLNYLKVSPYFSYSKSTSDGNSNISQIGNSQINNLKQNTLTDALTQTPNVGTTVLYNHRFTKPRRNVSLYAGISTSGTEGSQQTDFTGHYTDFGTEAFVKDSVLNQLINTDNSSWSTFSRFSYIEPVGKKSTLEFNWDYNLSKYDNSRETRDLAKAGLRVDSLSNLYNYSFASNNFGLNYRFTEAKYYISLGVSGQPTELTGNSLSTGLSSNRSGFNIVPIARFSYKFSRSKELNISYYGRSNEPNYSQIQPVADRSNPNNPIIGNPNLDAEFTHGLSLRYNTTDFQTGRTLFTYVSANLTNDKIVTNNVQVVKNKTRIQETRFLNADGYSSLFGFYSLSLPFSQKKYVFGFSGSANYSNNLSFSDYVKNEGKNLVLTQRLRMQINPTDNIEFNPSASYSYNQTRNSLETLQTTNRDVSTWALNADTRITFLKTLVLGTDLSKNFNRGYTGSIAANPFILNTYLEKQFFKSKRGTLRLQGYDLLNQSAGVSRSVNGITTTDTRSNRLGRYFMMSFTMRIQKFTGVKPDDVDQGPSYRRDREHGSSGRSDRGSGMY